ncbi:MAG: aminotransferase class V-fold PLP-dependent enzyme [Oscillospiraceae bacterium]|nr:aminotransferase class V-fold PLP-dependent enzyme [Oscillospiraceae bacterium]
MIYLDSAATTFRKPTAVREAVLRAMQTMSSPGRGGYASARAAEQTLFRCRSLAAGMFGVSEPERVIFTMNATHGLNIAIKSLVPQGGRAVVSGYEHNAVTRPLHALGAETVVAASPLFESAACVRAFERALWRGADAAICTAASNVFGFALPIERIAALCRRAGVPLIIDASQSAGVLPLDMDDLGAAFVAMPGHKGLYGPQGTGLLLCGTEAKPLLEGGTGSESLNQDMPSFLPDRLEAGTHNMPGIAGLEAGLRFVAATTPQRITRHERALIRRAADGLRRLDGLTVFASEVPDAQIGVLSFAPKHGEPEALSEELARRGIAVRAGYQCAPLAHRTAQTLEHGTVRVSVSALDRAADIDGFLYAVRGILSK